MKAILISIKPKWVEKILNGEKTIEIRKTCPVGFKNLKPYEGCSIDVYIYCTKNKILGNLIKVGSQENSELFGKNAIVGINKGFMEKGDIDLQGKIVAKFTLNKVETIHSYYEPEQWYKTNETSGSNLMKKSCLSFEELDSYLLSGDGYVWHIEKLEIFDKPKELSDFKPYTCNKCDFQLCSYCNIRPLTKAPQSWCYVEGGK